MEFLIVNERVQFEPRLAAEALDLFISNDKHPKASTWKGFSS